MRVVIIMLCLAFATYQEPDIRLMRPVSGPILQVFGVDAAVYAKYGQRGHNGIDFRVPVGTLVEASASGEVVDLGYQEAGYGRYVLIQHDDFQTLYAHLSKITVRYKQKVAVGQYVGLSGSSGGSYIPHLHFELRVPGAKLPGYPQGARNPKPYFVQDNRPVRIIERTEQ